MSSLTASERRRVTTLPHRPPNPIGFPILASSLVYLLRRGFLPKAGMAPYPPPVRGDLRLAIVVVSAAHDQRALLLPTSYLAAAERASGLLLRLVREGQLEVVPVRGHPHGNGRRRRRRRRRPGAAPSAASLSATRTRRIAVPVGTRAPRQGPPSASTAVIPPTPPLYVYAAPVHPVAMP